MRLRVGYAERGPGLLMPTLGRLLG
jgi:hypothetical protein